MIKNCQNSSSKFLTYCQNFHKILPLNLKMLGKCAKFSPDQVKSKFWEHLKTYSDNNNHVQRIFAIVSSVQIIRIMLRTTKANCGYKLK